MQGNTVPFLIVYWTWKCGGDGAVSANRVVCIRCAYSLLGRGAVTSASGRAAALAAVAFAATCWAACCIAAVSSQKPSVWTSAGAGTVTSAFAAGGGVKAAAFGSSLGAALKTGCSGIVRPKFQFCAGPDCIGSTAWRGHTAQATPAITTPQHPSAATARVVPDKCVRPRATGDGPPVTCPLMTLPRQHSIAEHRQTTCSASIFLGATAFESSPNLTYRP